jgi:CBS domain-containing protein
MVAGGFRHLPVVDEQDRVVGMLSMRDLARAGVQGATAKV